eukprot:752760-Hanusia_phi.AAC.2
MEPQGQIMIPSSLLLFLTSLHLLLLSSLFGVARVLSAPVLYSSAHVLVRSHTCWHQEMTRATSGFGIFVTSRTDNPSQTSIGMQKQSPRSN